MIDKIVIKNGTCGDCYYWTEKNACTKEESCFLSKEKAYGELIVEYYKRKRVTNL